MENKRTYIRRKRCLNEITAMIKKAIVFINERNNSNMTQETMNLIARQRATEIEAACWFPKQHMTESEYSNLLMGKAKLLCQALVNSKTSPNAPVATATQVPTPMQPVRTAFTSAIPVIKPIPKIATPQPKAIAGFPEVEIRKANTPEKNLFMSSLPMNNEELRVFIEPAVFSFSSLTANSLPPLLDHSLRVVM